MTDTTYSIDSIVKYLTVGEPSSSYVIDSIANSGFELYTYFDLTCIPTNDIAWDSTYNYNNLVAFIRSDPNRNGSTYLRRSTYLQNVGIIEYLDWWYYIGYYHEKKAILLSFNGKTPEEISKE
jgi:hypothetical protein